MLPALLRGSLAPHISRPQGHTKPMSKAYFWKSVAQYIFFFFLASFCGYLWEVCLMLVKEGAFSNRGFLYGPWLPVYGTGAVLMLLLLRRWKRRPAAVFFLSVLLGGTVELVIGFLLDHVWELRYWDYSGSPLSVGGYVCLYSLLGFGIAGVLWVCVLARLASHLWKKIPVPLQCTFLTLLILAFLIDCAAALIFPNQGSGVTF